MFGGVCLAFVDLWWWFVGCVLVDCGCCWHCVWLCCLLAWLYVFSVLVCVCVCIVLLSVFDVCVCNCVFTLLCGLHPVSLCVVRCCECVCVCVYSSCFECVGFVCLMCVCADYARVWWCVFGVC